MIKKLLARLLILAALFNSPSAFAETASMVATVSMPIVQPLPNITATTRIKSGEICPPLPAATDPWPAATASLVGGCQTTTAQQRYTANTLGLPAASTEAEFAHLVAIGHFVPIDSPHIVFKKDENGKVTVRPYVLAETAQYAVATAAAFQARGCGSLTITDAGRLKGERRYGKEHPYTVHPYGMAVDFRLNGLSPECASWLRAYSIDTEVRGEADSTEHDPPHVHVVVRPARPTVLAQTRQTAASAEISR